MTGNNKSDEVVVLFSGGTDSTLTAALSAEQFEKVHLVTFHRFSFFSTENTRRNFAKLSQKFGEDKFDHQIIKYDRIFKHVTYERYLRNLARYGFMLLSTCGLCKLAMHVRAAMYCLEHGVGNLADGANKGMHLFPAQMARVVGETMKMYASVGITYDTPVFKYEGPQNIDFTDRLNLEKITTGQQDTDDERAEQEQKTTGYQLYRMGLMPSVNVKGTKLDRQMQPRCFQFILSNIFVHWWFLSNRSYEEYEEAVYTFYKGKIERFTELLHQFADELDKPGKKKSKLARLKEDR